MKILDRAFCRATYFSHNFGKGWPPALIRESEDYKLKPLGLPNSFPKISRFGENSKKKQEGQIHTGTFELFRCSYI